MTEVAIRTDGLGKRYQLGARERYQSLRDTIADSFVAPFRRLRRVGRRAPIEGFWALRDVSLELASGSVVGIVGRNGAGKTTLLKVLSRITFPTEGSAEIRGRIGSLLEVGTGFHPELSGRENIYLNGAILGMRRAEIDRQFDRIVAFSEVERHLDTPVKRYSSGMFVRLAFAVAAHLETDILLVDEVLAVGDASFQRRSLGKMEELSGEGRTVLFVSHNLGMVKTLTRTAIWLDDGHVREIGPSGPVVDRYLAETTAAPASGSYRADDLASRRVKHPKYEGQLRLEEVTLRSERGEVTRVFPEGSSVILELVFSASAPAEAFDVYVRLRTVEGQLLFTCLPGQILTTLKPGRHTAKIVFDLGPLLPGPYRGDIVLLSYLPQDNVSPAFEIDVVPASGTEDDHRTVLFGSGGGESYSGLGVMRTGSRWVDVPGDPE